MSATRNGPREVPAVYMRGGTSRALIFHARDLPADGKERDSIFLSAMGSPDPNGRQLDGMGGGISSLSKIAIVAPSRHSEADVDYTFGQVAVDQPLVQYKANCGNISAAIGPFAVDEGLVGACGETATVRIFNTNTGKIIHSTFPVSNGSAAIHGDLQLDGVAGSGAPIKLAFMDPGGAATGRLLPTSLVREEIHIDPFGALSVSLVDAANPVVIVAANQLRLVGTELPAEISTKPGLLEALEKLRAECAVRMGIVRDEDEARTVVRNLPQIAIVSPPASMKTIGGNTLGPDRMDIIVRMISAGQCHLATPLTGAMCLAIAMKIPGSVAASVTGFRQGSTGDMVIAHPSGTLQVAADLEFMPDPLARSSTVYRSARRIMRGTVNV